MTRPTVWIGVHDLSLSGVPIVLERLLAAVDPADRAGVHVVALRDGPMAERIRAVAASLTVLGPEIGRSTAGSFVAGARSVGLDAAASAAERTVWRRAVRSVPVPDVVVVHGAGAWPIVRLAPRDTPMALHLHELDAALDRCIPPSVRPSVFAGASSVMVVSGPVADLARRCGVSGDRIHEVPGVFDPAPPHDPGAALDALGGAGPWVLGAGEPGWRKGTDRMPALAFGLSRSGVDVTVGWVGGPPGGVDAGWVEAPDPVHWFAPRDDPWALLAGATAFVVPSREDPLPLVALEAGRHRRAVVATPSGGLSGLLADGRGLLVDDHDLRSLVAATRRVLSEPGLADELGAALGEHVERHHHPDVVAPRWWDVVRGACD